MKIIVNPHNVRIIKEESEPINELEVNVSKCEFEFAEEITNEFTKEAYFTLDGNTYKQTIINNECDYPSEVLTEKGTLEVGVVAYKVVNGQELIRYNPTSDYFPTWEGSLKEADNTEPITPTDKEQMQSQISQNAANISNLQTSKQDKLIQGENITIDENNVISAADTIYDDTEIREDIQELQETKIDKNVNNLTYYTLTTETGSKITLSIDALTYVMTLKLKDKNNNDISTDSIDLPLETMVVGARYDSTTKEIVLTLKNGQEVRFSVADLVSGLQTEITEDNKLSSDLVDDINNINKFVSAEEKTQIVTNKNDITAIKDGQNIDSFSDVETALELKEDKSNKVTEINSSSTDTQYPSAKCVYNSQEQQNEQIAELEMLYNAFPTVSDEDTEIQLDNTAKVKFREIDLKGNTSQVVIPEETGTSVSDTSIYVTDVDTDKENTIELSGNTYQYTTTGKNLLPNDRSVKVPVSLTSGTTLVLSTKNSVASLGGNVKLYDIDNNTVWFAISEGATSATKTLNKDIYYIENKLDGTIEYQCEIGSTPTSFEQYTGGKPSPAPAYPQNIEIVTGTQNVTISNGDNTQNTVYPINLGNIELYKIGTYQDKIYKINNKWYLYKELNKVTLNGAETWKGGNQGTVSTNFRYMYTTVPQSVGTSPANIKCNNFQIDVVTASLVTNRSAIGTSSSSTDNLRVMIDETLIENPTSSSEALTNWRNWLSTHNTIVYYALATPITTEITDTNLVNQLNALYNATIYSTTNITTDTSNLLPYIDLHYNFTTPSPSPDKPSNINVVKENNTITISNNDNTESQVFSINIGNTELCKIGEYQDYIYENNGNWFFKKNIGKITLNGSEDWTYDSQYSRFYTTISNSLYTGSRINIFCNYYLYASSGHANGTSFMFHSNVYLYNNSYSTTNDFKNWLSTHNTIVYYVLTMPTDTQITDIALITQLNNIKKAYSYDTQTNISQTNADNPFIIYAEAIRNLKDVFE